MHVSETGKGNFLVIKTQRPWPASVLPFLNAAQHQKEGHLPGRKGEAQMSGMRALLALAVLALAAGTTHAQVGPAVI